MESSIDNTVYTYYISKIRELDREFREIEEEVRSERDKSSSKKSDSNNILKVRNFGILGNA